MPGKRLWIHCRQPVLQIAFTHLAHLAGLMVCETPEATIPLLTDDRTKLSASQYILWVHQEGQGLPKGIRASVSLLTTSDQLREAAGMVTQGNLWGISQSNEKPPPLSERELEIITLLSQGL